MLRIEFEMRKQGITQKKLAELAGLNRIVVNRVLRGRDKPWPKWRAALAAALDWPQDRADELFHEVEVK